MKRRSALIIALLFTVSFLNVQHLSAQKKSAVPQPANSAINQGKALLPKYDCLACHKLNQKLVGPSYTDVAHKYPNTPANIALLIKKIISGGSGKWGTNVMAPHPNLPVKDAEKMVAYILSLR